MVRLVYTVLSLLAFCWSIPAAAEDQNKSPAYYHALEQLEQSNKTNIWQNAGTQRARDVLADRIVDEKSKVIGEVRDLILGPSGTIEQIDAEFNRLRLGRINVGFSQLSLKGVPSGYQSDFNEDQIADMLPTILSGVETAAGNENIVSLKRILGAPLKSQNGDVLGKVEDVLFESNGAYAEYVRVTLTHRGLKRGTLVIPYSMVNIRPGNENTADVSVPVDMALAMNEFAAVN